MEEVANESQLSPEQPITETPVTPNKRRQKPMAVATQEQNGQAIAQEGGKPKKERSVGLLPSAAGEQKPVTFNGKIIEETTWAALKARRLFSVNSDGSHPYLKISKSSYLDLVTEEPVTGVPLNTNQKVYRIKLL